MNSVYILMDKSGSMSSKVVNAVKSINDYLKELPEDTNVYFTSFDSNSYDVVRSTTIKHYDTVMPVEINARGGTPLYDSTARLINKAISDAPDKAVFVIMTDGFENCSTDFTFEQIQKLLKSIQNERKWEVVFLGAEFTDVNSQAQGLGIKTGKMRNMDSDVMYAATSMDMTRETRSYFSTGKEINLDENV